LATSLYCLSFHPGQFGVATFEGRRSWADDPINHGPTDRLTAYTAAFSRG
jgi:hypothetical protein